jgi:hypothetical protein
LARTTTGRRDIPAAQVGKKISRYRKLSNLALRNDSTAHVAVPVERLPPHPVTFKRLAE